MEEAPALEVGEGCSAYAQRSNAGQEAHQDHVFHGHLSVSKAQALLHLMEEVADKCVHPLSQALEHDQSERDAQHGVKHAENLPRISAWCCVSVSLAQGERENRGYTVAVKHDNVFVFMLRSRST